MALGLSQHIQDGRNGLPSTSDMRVLHIAMGMPEFDRAARELGHEVTRAKWSTGEHVRAIDAALADPPDLVFMQLHGAPVNLDGVRKLREAGSLVVEWFGDVRDPLPQSYVNNFPFVSVTACTNMPDVETMRGMGHDARFLQIGYDETIFNTTGPTDLSAPDVVFLGSNYRGKFPLSDARAAMVEAMQRAFGHRFKVYGKGWNPRAPYLNNEQEAAIYRGCKVAINFDHFDRPGFHSDRLLRAMACGAMVIDGRLCAGWDVDVLVDNVRQALAHPERTKEHGRKNAESAYLNGRWHNRIRTLEGWVTGVEVPHTNTRTYTYTDEHPSVERLR